MKRNARLLNKAADRIEKIPRSYYQANYILSSGDAPCGTKSCLAGEIIICSERSVTKGVQKLRDTNDTWLSGEQDKNPGIVAGKLAGLTPREVDCLFQHRVGDYWPEPYAQQWAKAKTERGRGGAAVRLLRYLAKGGEVY